MDSQRGLGVKDNSKPCTVRFPKHCQNMVHPSGSENSFLAQSTVLHATLHSLLVTLCFSQHFVHKHHTNSRFRPLFSCFILVCFEHSLCATPLTNTTSWRKKKAPHKLKLPQLVSWSFCFSAWYWIRCHLVATAYTVRQALQCARPRATNTSRTSAARVFAQLLGSDFAQVMSPKSNATACRNYDTERLHDACCWFEVSRTRGTSRSVLTVELQRRSSWYFNSCFLQSTMCPIFLQNQWPPRRLRLQQLNKLLGDSWLELPFWKQVQPLALAAPTRQDLGTMAPQPLGLSGPMAQGHLTITETQDVDLTLSQATKTNMHEVPSYYSFHVNQVQHTSLSGFIAKKVRTCQTRIRDESCMSGLLGSIQG